MKTTAVPRWRRWLTYTALLAVIFWIGSLIYAWATGRKVELFEQVGVAAMALILVTEQWSSRRKA